MIATEANIPVTVAKNDTINPKTTNAVFNESPYLLNLPARVIVDIYAQDVMIGANVYLRGPHAPKMYPAKNKNARIIIENKTILRLLSASRNSFVEKCSDGWN